MDEYAKSIVAKLILLENTYENFKKQIVFSKAKYAGT